MQSAPSVVYPVGRSVFYGVVIATLGFCAGAGLLWGWWSARQAAPDHVLSVRWLLGGLCWLGWVVFARWSWLRQPVGALRWDPQAPAKSLDGPAGAWFWLAGPGHVPPLVVEPKMVFDWQGWCLLHLPNASLHGRWLWLARGQDPTRWDDVRRALVALR
jgi:toxin CptA